MADEFDPYRMWLGIPPEEQPPNIYRLLGIGLFEADLDVIQEAADRQMAQRTTPQAGTLCGPFAKTAERIVVGQAVFAEGRPQGTIRPPVAFQAGGPVCRRLRLLRRSLRLPLRLPSRPLRRGCVARRFRPPIRP